MLALEIPANHAHDDRDQVEVEFCRLVLVLVLLVLSFGIHTNFQIFLESLSYFF